MVNLVLLAALLQFGAPATPSPSCDGEWSGTLMNQLRLVVKLTRTDGKLGGSVVSVDQGGAVIPVDEASCEGGQLKLRMARVAATYAGTLSKDGQEIAGTWTQSMPLALTLRRGTAPPAPHARPQEPKKPYPYAEEEVTYENRWGAVKLAGTLTLPRGKGPFPAVVLITGSGAQNRDEEILGHKPFLVIADALTRRGFAVLRVDDRGMGGSTGNVMQATSEDFAWDVLAGVQYLKGRKEIDARHIGLVGHSEGGIIAPMVAAGSKDVAFIVLLAGTGLDGSQILALQQDRIARAEGKTAAQIAESRALNDRAGQLLRGARNPFGLEAELRALIAPAAAKEGQPPAAVDGAIAQMLSPWFRFFFSYDPKPTLRKVRCPVLAINGALDLQVPPKENLPAIEAALKEGGNKDVTVRELAGLNHLFQHAKTGSPKEYAEIEETFAPEALTLVGDWLVAHAKK